MTKPSSKTLVAIVSVAIAAGAGLVVWKTQGPRWTLSNAIDDILASRNVGKARETLKQIGDRGRVVAALRDAVDEDTTKVSGKIDLIDTLIEWQEPRAARRALNSDSKSSRRAAAWKFHNEGSIRDDIKATVLDWIKDDAADSRGMAAMIANRLKLEECVPALMAALDTAPEETDDVMFVSQAMDALIAFNPKGFAERVLAMAESDTQPMMLRMKAFDVVARAEDTPTERVQALLLGVLKDRNVHKNIRSKAASALRRGKFANAEVWDVLEGLLLEEGADTILQRTCLWSLGETAPIDRIKKLLLDRRVYNNPYFGIRVDVASGLAALHVQERIALEILCQLMEEDDPKDLDLLVPQEAWLSFYKLTGLAHGVKSTRLFPRRPGRPINDEAALRGYLWAAAFQRPGVSPEMVESVRQLTTSNLDEVNKGVAAGRRVAKKRDLEQMKSIATISRNQIDQLLASIQEEKERIEKAAKDNEAKVDEPQGPVPPKDE